MLYLNVEGVSAIATSHAPDASSNDRETRFRRFFADVEPGLRRALTAAYGPDLGSDATSDAMSWAWENFDRLEAMENPAGYLWRVGQSSTRRELRHRVRRSSRTARPTTWPDIEFEPGLGPALAELSASQRTAVLLVHGHGYSLGDAADQMNCRVSTLRNHLERGMTRLQRRLGVTDG